MENRTIKRILGRTIGIALCVFMALLIMFELTDAKSPYHEEKALWKLNKKLQNLSRDPEYTPPVIFRKLTDEYQLFIEKNPDSPLVVPALMQISQISILQKDFVNAQKPLETIVEKYKDQPEIAVEAIAEMGRIYNQQNKIDDVLSSYRRIIAEYPLTSLGMVAPLTIYQIYKVQNNNNQAAEYLNEAIAYYHNLAKKEEGRRTGFILSNYLAKAYLENNEWGSALKLYEKILTTYATANYFNEEFAQTVIRSINTLSITRLNDYTHPIKVYESFIAKYPGHPLKATMQRIIKSLDDIINAPTFANNGNNQNI